jgi:hypothetical protein
MRMPGGPTPLIQIAALCQMLLEALEKLDDEIASEAFIADLREMCERAHGELLQRAQDSGS